MDEIAIFRGEFGLNAAVAHAALTDFVRNGNPASLGEWCNL